MIFSSYENGPSAITFSQRDLQAAFNPLEPPGGSVLLRELVNATTSYGSNEGTNILVNNISICLLLFLYLWHRFLRYL